MPKHSKLVLSGDGSGRYDLLEAGQSFLVDAPGLTLVMALFPSTLQLRESSARLSRWRYAFDGWLRSKRLRTSSVH